MKIQPTEMRQSLLLLSGGIDSVALAAWIRPAFALTVDYGQAAALAETTASSKICQVLSIKHTILKLPLNYCGSGTMAGESQSPHSENEEFWPFRNQLLVTLAGMVALKENISKVILGTVVSDQRHADGRPEFTKCMNRLLEVQEGGVVALTPASAMSSGELVKQSGIQISLLAWAHSCHRGNLACGSCAGCRKHSETMSQLGIDR